MLIEFKISNYRSIAEEQILSFVPSSIKKHPQNILKIGKQEALNVVGIYGANASGKSNLLLAMSLLRKMLHTSAISNSTTPLPYDPFLLREGWETKPTQFETTFVIDGTRYRFGFSYNQSAVLSEWLFRKKIGREVELYYREGDVIEVSSGLRGNSKLIDTAIESTRANALFLSFCDIFNVAEAKAIFKWFRNFYMVDGLNTDEQPFEATQILQDESFGTSVKEFLMYLNLGFDDVIFKMAEDEKNGVANQKTVALQTQHKIYDKDGKPTNRTIGWNLKERESAGTQQVYEISKYIIWTLSKGGVLIIDEIEAKMHALITVDIINLFLNPKTNPNQAQLIFATHDTNLLTYGQLRRDQIYFTEKNAYEATTIYALSDFTYLKGNYERPDVDKEKRYMEGRYGAVPVLNDFKPRYLTADE